MLTANQQTKALGTLRLGEANRFSYSVYNSATTPIKVKQIRLGCGSCTQASISKSSLSADEKASVDVVFTPNSTGIQTKNIYIDYELNEKAYTLQLQFTAQVHG